MEAATSPAYYITHATHTLEQSENTWALSQGAARLNICFLKKKKNKPNDTPVNVWK